MGRIASEDALRHLRHAGILRIIAEGEMSNLGDTTTLLDPGVVEEIKGGRV